MPTSTSSVLFAASLCVATAAQSPASSALPPLELTSALAGGGGSATTPRAHADLGLSGDALLRSVREAQQEPDYSLRGMFQQTHGDFMLRRERFNPMVEIGASSLTEAGLQHEQGRFDLFHLNADFEAPLMVSTEAYILLGAFFESRHYQAKNMIGFNDENLFSAGLKAGFGWFLDKDILLEGMITPGSWSDWDATLHHNDFDFPASALLTVRYSNELFWKIGIRYNEVFEDANILPWLGFSWVTDSVRVDLLAPESLEVSLWPSPDFGILFGTRIQGAEYHVRTGLNSVPSHEPADVRVQEVLLYTGALWRLSDYSSVTVRGGASVAGDYKLDDGAAATKLNSGTLEPALFLDVSLGIDF